MRTLCFTVDLDRDVNEPIFGSVCAGSKDRGDGNSPRFVSAGKGTERLVDLFDDLGVKATFFAEARTLHRSGAFIRKIIFFLKSFYYNIFIIRIFNNINNIINIFNCS